MMGRNNNTPHPTQRLAEIALLALPRDPDAQAHYNTLALAIAAEQGRRCEQCGNGYARTRAESPAHWARRRFCSRSCAGQWSSLMAAERRRLAKIEDAEWIIGTDAPERIARRLGYGDPENLRDVLRRWGRDDLASRLLERVA
jgi:hypothetical protein